MAPKNPEKLEGLAQELRHLTETLAAEQLTNVSRHRAKRVREAISAACIRLEKVVEGLDPIRHPETVFDPSNPGVVGRIVGITLVAQDRKPLSRIEPFYGSGVYALYYTGKFPAYRRISGREHPIYVGKADPADPASTTASGQGVRLSNRLNDHRRNIGKATSTLRVEDFEYRVLVVQTGWQASAEEYLIHLFRPIWNSEVGICYGFGKHGDAPQTRANQRSPWDTLHPGRSWAYSDPDMKDARPTKRIVADIKRHLTDHPPVGSINEILRRFLEEIRVDS